MHADTQVVVTSSDTNLSEPTAVQMHVQTETEPNTDSEQASSNCDPSQPQAKKLRSLTTPGSMRKNSTDSEKSFGSTTSSINVASNSSTNPYRTRSSTSKPPEVPDLSDEKVIQNKVLSNPAFILKTLEKADISYDLTNKSVKRLQRKRPLDVDHKSKELSTSSQKSEKSLNNTESMIVDSEESSQSLKRKTIHSFLSASSSNLNTPTSKPTSTVQKSMIDSLKQDKLANTPTQSQIRNDSVPNQRNEDFNLDNVKKLSYSSALKLAYLNTTGVLNDSLFDFMLESLPIYNSLNSSQHKNIKNLLNKQIIDQIDKQISIRTAHSPLYSLILQTDENFSFVYVSIIFIDHSSLNREKNADNSTDDVFQNNQLDQTNTSMHKKYIIKLFDLKPLQQQIDHNQTKLNGLNEIKLSKYIFEQLKVNVITQFRLNKQNLMSISIDTNLLDRLCFSTLQMYLNDLLNKFIVILPCYRALSSVELKLNEWTFKTKNGCSYSLRDYFNIYSNLLEYFEATKNTEFLECFKPLDCYAFSMDTLPEFIRITELIYTNYSRLVAEPNSQNSNIIKHDLFNQINSIDYYFMTCMLCDLLKFLYDYKLNPKRFSCLSDLVMPWHLKGSYLKNLLSEQLIETSDKSQKVLISTENNKELIECENNSIEHLVKMKDSMEKILMEILDFGSEKSENKQKFSYLITNGSLIDTFPSSSSNQGPISMLDINSYLNEMFDMSFKNIKYKDSKFSPTLRLNDNQLQKILDYYEFRDLVSTDRIKTEYFKFFNVFFASISDDLMGELNNDLMSCSDLDLEKSLDQLNVFTRSLMEPTGQIREKFIKFVYQSNKEKFCPVLSFLATIYLCLPTLVDLDDDETIRLWSANKKSLSTQELISLELRLKLLGLVETPVSNENCLIKLEQIPYIDLSSQ